MCLGRKRKLEISALENKINGLQDKIGGLQNEKDGLRRQNTELEQENAWLKEQLSLSHSYGAATSLSASEKDSESGISSSPLEERYMDTKVATHFDRLPTNSQLL